MYFKDSYHQGVKVFFAVMLLQLFFPLLNAQGQLTRKQLINRALNDSYTIKNQRNVARQTQYDIFKLYQTYIPGVSFNMSYTHLNDDIQFGIPAINLPLAPGKVISLDLPPITLQERNIFKTDISATMVLFTGLKVPYALNSLKHKMAAEDAIAVKEEVSVIKEVADYYDRLALIDQSLMVLNESELRLQRESAFADKAYKQGLIGAYDLSKIDIAVQELAARRIELSSNRRLVISKLYQLTGVSKDSLENIHPQLQVFTLSGVFDNPEERPELKALNERTEAGKSKSKMMLTPYLPNIVAFGKKEMRTEDLSAFDPQWYAGIGLRWNIFDGGLAYRDFQKARIDEDIARNDLLNARELFNLNLEKALSDAMLASELIAVADKRRITAEKGLELATRQYELGLSSITERLAAETDLQKAKFDFLQSIYNQRVASVSILEASGRLNTGSLE